MFAKTINFFKRPRNYILTGVAVVILIYLVFGRGGTGNAFQTAIAGISTVQQEVSVTGRIKSAQNVDLVFEAPGKISWISAKVGQKVFIGQALMSLDTTELNAQLQNSQANLKSAQAKYDQLVNGARPEDLAIYKANLESAKSSLLNTEKLSLDSIINSLMVLTDAQYEYFNDGTELAFRVKEAKGIVMEKVYGDGSLGGIATFYFAYLSNIITPKIDQAKISGDFDQVIATFNETRVALEKTKNALDIVYNALSVSSTKTSIGSARATILNQISALDSAKGAFESANNQLTLKESPPTEYDLQIVQSQLDQARAGVTSIQAQIAKRVLRAPISGIVANIEGSVGEISNASKPAVSIISDSKYEIEVSIPEADISKIKIGNEAVVTTDAYGSDISWVARVTKIYPAEQMIDGVATYKTVLQFDKTDDRIRSGMTANIDIATEKKENVLAIPQRAVIRRDNGKFVKVLVEKKDDGVGSQFANLKSVFEDEKIAVYEVQVETGIRGNDGKIEITSGLTEGEKVVTN